MVAVKLNPINLVEGLSHAFRMCFSVLVRGANANPSFPVSALGLLPCFLGSWQNIFRIALAKFVADFNVDSNDAQHCFDMCCPNVLFVIHGRRR